MQSESVLDFAPPAERGYRPLTEAMVDIRATIVAAREARVVSTKGAAVVTRAAKAQFFKERTWDLVLERARSEGAAHRDLTRLKRWLPANRVARKRRDALQLVRKLRRMANSGRELEPFRAGFRFSDTVFWRVLKGELAAERHA